MVLATAGASRISGAHTDGNRNVGDAERVLSVVAGGVLAAYGLRRRDLPGVGLALLGAELVYRGAAGHSFAYDAFGVDTTRWRAPARRADGALSSGAATVNARHAIKVERTVTIARPRDELYEFWRHFANLPRFMRHLESVTTGADGRSHWIARAAGRTYEWDAVIVNDLPNELIAWKTVDDPDVAHAGSVHFRDAAGGRGTEVRVVFDYEPPAGAMISAIGRLFGQAPDALVREELRRFKQLVESGETPTTEGQPSCRS